MLRGHLSAVALLGAIVLGSHAALAEVRYELYDLGAGVIPYDVNNSGQWAGSLKGYAVVGKGGELSYIGKDGAKMTPGAATSINSRGMAAGYWLTEGNTADYGFVYKPGERPLALELPSLPRLHAYGINENGDVTGYAWGDMPGLYSRAFRYSGGTFTQFPDVNNPAYFGFVSQAYALNSKGQVVGTAVPRVPNGTWAFVWNEDGTIAEIGTLGGIECTARDINEAGQVIGWSTTAAGQKHAFLYGGEKMTDLGTLMDMPLSDAYGINNKGQVVGQSYYADVWIPENPPPGPGHAFVYSNGQMEDLNNLLRPWSEWLLSEAYSINDQGWIVGVGEYLGQQHGFMLKPVPEPAAGLPIVAAGLMLLGQRAKPRSGR